jgi:signal transduction histidine kinase
VRCTEVLAEGRSPSNAIDNAIRHASAHVAVVLEIGRDGYELVVRDDGRGFDDEAKRHARSMGLEVRGIGSSGDVHAGISRARWGLTVLAEVANAIGASLTIETSTSGTLLRLTPRPKIGQSVAQSSPQASWGNIVATRPFGRSGPTRHITSVEGQIVAHRKRVTDRR